jgi:creatinine amidohydrolase
MIDRNLVDLTTEQIQDRLSPNSVIVLPVGAVEQHGPHLPVSTDLVIAQCITDAAVTRAADAGVDAWQLPALAFTKSDEHAWAPGTVALQGATFAAVLDDIGASLTRLPSQRLLFVNGHGGNVGVLSVALRSLRLAHGLQTFLVGLVGGPRPPSAIDEDEHGLGIHAGFDETSLMLHLRPDLVQMDRTRRSVPDSLRNYRHLGFAGTSATFGWTSEDFGPDGVIGDPRGATGEAGAQIAEYLIETVAATIAEAATFAF